MRGSCFQICVVIIAGNRHNYSIILKLPTTWIIFSITICIVSTLHFVKFMTQSITLNHRPLAHQLCDPVCQAPSHRCPVRDLVHIWRCAWWCNHTWGIFLLSRTTCFSPKVGPGLGSRYVKCVPGHALPFSCYFCQNYFDFIAMQQRSHYKQVSTRENRPCMHVLCQIFCKI